MLANDETSDDNVISPGYMNRSNPAPIDVFMTREGTNHINDFSSRRYSDALRRGGASTGISDQKTLRESKLDDSMAICSYCNRVGHCYENCWRRMGCCLICGSTKHKIRECQEYNVRGYSRGKNCYECGLQGHLKINCPRKNKVSCEPNKTEDQYVTKEVLSSWSSDIVQKVTSQIKDMITPMTLDSGLGSYSVPIQEAGDRGIPPAFVPRNLNFQAPSHEGGMRSN